jgi:hypothetical protein
MAVQIQLRRDSSTNWSNENPILAQGELGLELDTLKIKVGNGVDEWDDLDYLVASAVLDHISDTSNPHSVTKTQVGLGNVPDLDTTDAVNNQHTHSNKSLLDTYAQTETDLADAVSKKHDALTIGTNTASALSLSGQELSLGDVFVQGINTNKITVSDTEPSSPNTGDIWIDTGA